MLPTLLAMGCTPVLESPDVAGSDSGIDTTNCTWEAPKNTWEQSSPPSCMVGEGFDEGQIIPDMRVLDQHGNEISLWQFYGDLIVLDFSTMWCAPCAVLAEGVDETWEEFESDGFMYLTVLSQDVYSNVPDVEDLNQWAGDHSITAPVVSDDGTYTDEVIPPGGAFPKVMLIGRDMRVAVEEITPAEDATVRSTVRAAL
ncbi:MAG: peroxiredoxin [Myxococcota bacterium]|jgi:peroxiredoxin